jgi:hypothetical protein
MQTTTIDKKLDLRRSAIIGFSAIALSAVGSSAQAANLVQNGGFVPTGITQSAYLGYNSVTIQGWTFAEAVSQDGRVGYNFVVPDGTAFGTGLADVVNGPYGNLSLYNAPGQTVNSVDGSGWFIAADGAFEQGSISQTLNGLTVGQKYKVNFSQAVGQQRGFTGDTTDRFQVSFGGTSQLSTLVNLPSQAPVTDWTQETLTFTANASTQVLSFLAVGTPDGLPPFALLSGVSVNAVTVPEPFTIIGTLIGGTAAFRLKKKIEDCSK